MNYNKLNEKRKYYLQNRHLLSDDVLKNYETAFEIEYTHNSTAIEGNTLTLMETKLLLEDKLSVGGKNLREIYEIVNHNKAFAYIQKRIKQNKSLDENIIKDIHSILMENIMVGGIYRNVDVYISGAQHTLPSPQEMDIQIKNFYMDLISKNDLNPVELAAWAHADFVKVHPFTDGNGRISRLIMNYQLMANGFLPISMAKESRLEYFKALESYSLSGNIESFLDFISNLESARLDFYIKTIDNCIANKQNDKFEIKM
ncbi:MAG: filamentation induced by cAMP protein fic [Clostridiales bacterium 43-6]|nr:MAG: filamentation induced by cAMP protein fic [Clostridiales bacterium 43-6]